MPTKKDIEVAERLIGLEEFKKQVEEKIKWLYKNSATKQDVAIVGSKLEDLELELTDHRKETGEALGKITEDFEKFSDNTNTFLNKISNKISHFTGGLVVAIPVFSFVIYLIRDVLLKWFFG